MLKQQKIAVVIPAYNEEKLIGKTVNSLPEFVDHIVVVNDGSTDQTARVLKELNQHDQRLTILTNDPNQGIGASLVKGFNRALELPVDLVFVMAGDAQCDPNYLKPMVETLLDENLDYVKANRFMHLDALTQMPTYRRIGNIIITLLTKFSTGYYSIFDSQNGYGVFRRQTLERIRFDKLGTRYEYENALLLELSLANARIKDVAVPAIYGEETSTIPFFRTVWRALEVLWNGFWRRIYLKYILLNFHPVALFLITGLSLSTIGILFGIYITAQRIFYHLPPSTGTVMLAVLPLILGIQMLLTALILDVANEPGKN